MISAAAPRRPKRLRVRSVATPGIIFTIAPIDQIAFAATLMQSVRAIYPQSRRYIVLDGPAHICDGLDVAASLLDSTMLADPSFEQRVGSGGLQAGLLPLAFRHLLREPDAPQAIFMHPQLFLFRPFDDLLAALADRPAVVPHSAQPPRRPIDDPKHPPGVETGDGIPSLIAIANDGQGAMLVEDWAARSRICNGAGELRSRNASQLALGPYYLEHLGYMTAPATSARILLDEHGRLRVGEVDLVCFNFVGIDPGERLQPGGSNPRLPPLVADLCDDYRARVLANQWHTSVNLRADSTRPRAAPALVCGVWGGPAIDVAAWLSGDVTMYVAGVTVLIPRQAALLWQCRGDLQAQFPLRGRDDIEAFFCWVLSEGLQEESIQPDLFSKAFIAWLAEDAHGTVACSGAPFSNLMKLGLRLRGADGPAGLGHASADERKAWLDHALWCAFSAPARFSWPEAFVATLRLHFEEPSSICLGPYRLPRSAEAIWELRSDLQAEFPLVDDASRWKLLNWLLSKGFADYGIPPSRACQGLPAFLGTPWPGYAPLTRLAEFVYSNRKDLRAIFDLSTPDGIVAFAGWIGHDAEGYVADLTRCLQQGSEGTAELNAALQVQLALSGDWYTPSGIGEDLRCSVAALDAVGFKDYVIVDMPSGIVLRSDRVILPPGLQIQAAVNIVHHNAATAVEDWVKLRRLAVRATRVIGHWNWELARLPAQAAHAFSFYDEIWANTRFAFDAFDREQRRPVRLLSAPVIAVAPDCTRGEPPRAQGTVFLFMFDFGSFVARKNPHAAISAFARAFPAGNEPAQLLIKTQNGETQPDLLAELIAMAHDPRVRVVDQRLTRDETMAVLADCDAFISLHRSEGYGRGPLEAMLLGKPVIMTGYSGTNEYADERTARLVNYRLVPVQHGDYPGAEGQCWAEPDISDAAQAMRWVVRDPAAAKAMGRRAQEHVSRLLSPCTVGAQMLSALDLPLPAYRRPQSYLALPGAPKDDPSLSIGLLAGVASEPYVSGNSQV